MPITAPRLYAKRAVPSVDDAPPAVQALTDFLTRELGGIESGMAASRIAAVRVATTAVTLTAQDDVTLGDATGAAFTVTLPDVRRATGQVLTIKKVDASGNAVTVSAGTTTIDGAGTYPLPAQWNAVMVCSNGTAWFILATV
jgi:hypothetical protein